jgi:hypothetical protein
MNSEDVEEMNSILDTQDVLLRYYSPTCHHCIAMEESWNGLNQHPSLSGTDIYIVDANIDTSTLVRHKSGQDVQGKGVPTIYYISGDYMTQYDGDRSTEDMVQFVLNQSMSKGKSKRKSKRKSKGKSKRKSKGKSKGKSKRKSRQRGGGCGCSSGSNPVGFSLST